MDGDLDVRTSRKVGIKVSGVLGEWGLRGVGMKGSGNPGEWESKGV